MPVRTDFAPGEFCWIDLIAHDLDAASAWYGALFGWKRVNKETPGGGPPYAFLMQGEHVVGGMGQMSDEMKAMGIPPLWNHYIATKDCAATEAKVKELGGTVTVPTMEVPGFGQLAFFLDPEGAPFAAWEDNAGSDGPGMVLKEAGSLSWNELMSRDVEKAQAFYGSLTDWSFETLPMGDVPYSMIKLAGEDAGGMMPMDGPQFEGIPAHWLVYFRVEDCAETVAKVEATGGSIRVRPTAIPVGEFAVCADPQGGGFAIVRTDD